MSDQTDAAQRPRDDAVVRDLADTVAAVVVTWNAEKWLRPCVDSLARAGLARSTYVVDNDSKDGSADKAKQHYPDAHLIKLRDNVGFGRAANIGIRAALDSGVKYVMVMNVDITVEPDAVETMLRLADQHPEFGVLSPVQMNYDGTELDYSFCHYAPTKFWTDLYRGERQEIYEFRFMLAAIWMMRRDLLETVGGFDPCFFVYGEDDDLVERMSRRGYKVGIVPDARGQHHHKLTHNQPNPWQKMQLTKSDVVREAKRNSWGWCAGFIHGFADQALRAFNQLMRGRPGQWWAATKGMCSATFLLPRIARSRKRQQHDGAFILDAESEAEREKLVAERR